MSEFIRLVDNVTGNGDSKDFRELEGPYSLAFYGAFGAATVEFVFYSEDETGSDVELSVTADWSFSGTLPGPERYDFPMGMPFVIRVSGADESTNFGINAHVIRQ